MIAFKEEVEEWNEGKRVSGIGEQCEVGDELVLGGNLKIVSGLGLTVVHRILFHAHERSIGVCLRH